MTGVQRRWAAVVLTLLVVPGAIGFELWPLTGWRLFSASRDGTQTVWALEADGDRVDLESLPLAFRNAAWVLDGLPSASARRRGEVCDALREEIGARELRIARAHQRLTEPDGVWRTSEELGPPVVTCGEPG